MKKFWIAFALALTAFLLVTSADIAVASGTAVVKPYYDLQTKETYYDFSLNINQPLAVKHLAYVGTIGGDWFPQHVPDRVPPLVNQWMTEQGLEAKLGPITVGGGLALHHYLAMTDDVPQDIVQVYGSLAWTMWP